MADPVPLGASLGNVMVRMDQIMRSRQEATHAWAAAWAEGTLDQGVLPCANSCNGYIVLERHGEKAKGLCPAHMQEGVCPLVGKAERELEQRLERAGFAARYHHPDPDRIPARSVVEEYLRDLQANIKAGKGVMLTGDVGVGKTFALAYMARRMLAENIGVWKVHMSDLVIALNDRQTQRQTVERCLKVQVLMLDDWGASGMPPWVLDIMDGIVESRNGRLAPFGISTNLNPAQMKKDPQTRRIVDRWGESTHLIQMGNRGQRGK